MENYCNFQEIKWNRTLKFSQPLKQSPSTRFYVLNISTKVTTILHKIQSTKQNRALRNIACSHIDVFWTFNQYLGQIDIGLIDDVTNYGWSEIPSTFPLCCSRLKLLSILYTQISSYSSNIMLEHFLALLPSQFLECFRESAFSSHKKRPHFLIRQGRA